MRRLAAMALSLALGGCAAATPRAEDRASMQRPPTVDELLARGRGFAAVGDLTRAEQYFSAALGQGAPAPQVLPALLRVCMESGRYRVATAYAADAVQRDPENARLRLLHGLLEAAVGDVRVALREYQFVLRALPDDSNGHFAMALLLRDGLDDPAGADAQFREYLRLTPDGEHAADARAALLQRTPEPGGVP
jgi:tetratricopeptide (TPR) repeat protein